jgi:hypothetical protein
MSGAYRQRALECWRLAAATSNAAHRATLMEMAQAWMRLHEQAGRNAQLDLTYETPPPGRVSQPQQQQQQQQQQPPLPPVDDD